MRLGIVQRRISTFQHCVLKWNVKFLQGVTFPKRFVKQLRG